MLEEQIARIYFWKFEGEVSGSGGSGGEGKPRETCQVLSDKSYAGPTCHLPPWHMHTDAQI